MSLWEVVLESPVGKEVATFTVTAKSWDVALAKARRLWRQEGWTWKFRIQKLARIRYIDA